MRPNNSLHRVSSHTRMASEQPLARAHIGNQRMGVRKPNEGWRRLLCQHRDRGNEHGLQGTMTMCWHHALAIWDIQYSRILKDIASLQQALQLITLKYFSHLYPIFPASKLTFAVSAGTAAELWPRGSADSKRSAELKTSGDWVTSELNDLDRIISWFKDQNH